jgi:hypothetical protein
MQTRTSTYTIPLCMSFLDQLLVVQLLMNSIHQLPFRKEPAIGHQSKLTRPRAKFLEGQF